MSNVQSPKQQNKSDKRTLNQGKRTSLPIAIKTASWAMALMLLLFVAAFYMTMSDKLVPKTHVVEVNTISEQAILSPKQIEDEEATEKARQEAATQVTVIERMVPLRHAELLELIFERAMQINVDTDVTTEAKISIFRNSIPDLRDQHYEQLLRNLQQGTIYNDLLIEEISDQLTAQRYRMPEEIFFKMPMLTEEQLVLMKPVAADVLRRAMNDQISNAETVRNRVAEWVSSSTLAERLEREVVIEWVRFAISPNRFVDEVSTEIARQEAIDATETIWINQGDVLIQAGEVVTAEVYERLLRLELLREQRNVWPPVGLLLFSVLLVTLLFLYLRQHQKKFSNQQMFLLVLVFILNLLLMNVVSFLQTSETMFLGYLAPVALGSMLIAVLLDVRVAMFSSVIFAVIAAVIFNVSGTDLFDYRFGVVALTGGFIAAFTMNRATQRTTIIRAGIGISLMMAAMITALLLLEENYEQIWWSVGSGIMSGLLTAVLAIGLMPFFEMTFGVLSNMKLVELSNPNHPLLRKLITETPGTYHHSLMVGNLSESAAEAIGANGLLCRVGSFYHDVGKTKRPNYFIENQLNGENPHDFLDPERSAAIIIAHPRDGVQMLKAHNIPKPIRDIAEQHHGTTLLKFFFHKAMQQAGDGDDVQESTYRYPGQKAQTKEAAIVGIADCIEAAVRSLRQPTIEHIEAMIRSIIKDRLDDGQFNECDLTLKELDIVARSLKETLQGIFHSRIEYPTEAGQVAVADKEALS